MKKDIFENLMDWGPVLSYIHELSDQGRLSEHQPELIRILRYKGNWRLREEVLKRVGGISNPSRDLFKQVFAIMMDDNIYIEARILACHALIQLMINTGGKCDRELLGEIRETLEKVDILPQPVFLETAFTKLRSVMNQYNS